MKIYHYTKDFHVPTILNDECIKLEVVDGILTGTAKPLAWFTAEEFVPNAARPIELDWRGIPYKYSEEYKFYRFIFDSSNSLLHQWNTFQKQVKGSKYKARIRRRAKKQKDNINKWYVSFAPVPIEYTDGVPNYEEASLQPNAPSLVPVGAHSD